MPLTARQIEIDTPEHVALGFALADLGSRFAALLLDTLLIGTLLMTIWLGAILVGSTLAAGFTGLTGWVLGVLILVTFVVLWGYFIYFEARHDGQTPGKRAMGIRVVQDGGFPVTLRAAAIRNLVRFVDVQPVPTCLVGGLCMLLHPATRRLGDLAAGTVVVRERAIVRLPEESGGPARAGLGPPRLGEEAYAALAGFVARRDTLTYDVRERLAGRLAARFDTIVPRAPRVSAETYLDELYADDTARRAAAGTSAALGSAAAAALVRRQQPIWTEYLRLLERARRGGVKQLPEAEVSRFAALYRETAADLARARTYRASAELRYTLERIVGAGHNLLYRPPRLAVRDAWAWIRTGFPALVRRRWQPIAIAALALYLPAILAFAAIRAEPARARDVLPAPMLTRAEEALARDAEGIGYVEVPDVFMPVMATSIIANNVQVTFVAFAGGLLAGLGTALVLVLNGVLLGSVAALFANHGASLYLWTFVLPHGVIELTAIAIAGGAGLWLGSAIVLPGRETRAAALAHRGREAIGLVAGTAVLLLVAGLIEGFISPAPLPRAVKLAAAAVFALLLVLYLLTPAPADER